MIRLVETSTGNYNVRVDSKNGLCDWPILYDDGQVGWDHPEWFSKREREQAARVLKSRKSYTKSVWHFWQPGMYTMNGHTRFWYTWQGSVRSRWPIVEFKEKAEKLLNRPRVKNDTTILGGYYSDNNGDCLLCVPAGHKVEDIY